MDERRGPSLLRKNHESAATRPPKSQTPSNYNHQRINHFDPRPPANPPLPGYTSPSPRQLSTMRRLAKRSHRPASWRTPTAGPADIRVGLTSPSPTQPLTASHHLPRWPKQATNPSPGRGGRKIAHGGAEGGTVGIPQNGMNPAGVTGWPRPKTPEPPAKQPFPIDPNPPKLSSADKTCHSPPKRPENQQTKPMPATPSRWVSKPALRLSVRC